MSDASDRPLNILMVDSHGGIQRGGAVQCERLAVGLARRGHKVTCVFDGAPGSRPEGAGFARLRDAGVDVQCYRLLGPVSVLKFRREQLAKRPDVVHCHKNMAVRFIWAAALGRPDFPWIANRGTVYRLLPATLAGFIYRRKLDAVIAVADAVRDALIRDGVPPERAHVVYGSFDAERFRPERGGTEFRAKWGVAPEAPLIGMLASFKSRKKGHREFISAAAGVLAERPDARFVIVGEGDNRKLKAHAEEVGVGDRLIFAGFVEDTPGALAAMDIVLSASLRGEGLTGALREAFAMARPVVSTNVAGNREIVRPGETGVLVSPGDPDALARGINEILSLPDRGRSLGARGRELILQCCTNEVRAERVEQIYRMLIEKRSQARS